MTRYVRCGLVCVLAAAALSCGGGDGGDGGPATAPAQRPNPAVIAIDLTTPNADDGAVLLTVTGAGVDSVTSASYAVSAAPASSTTRILVYGNITSGALARVHIRDARRQGEYSVRVDEVAARQSFVQRSAASYKAILRPE